MKEYLIRIIKDKIDSLIIGSKESKEVAVQFFGGKPYHGVDSNLESLTPAGQSKETEIDIGILYQYFKEKLDEDIVYIVYRGLSGEFYTAKYNFNPKIVDE